ncbi:peptidoglycan-binding protein [Clostridium sp. C8-1-8]|uniref:peptidoglycan-binding protein n=1 Tax=Clostridium sp. C8-1-8 TaxID=2698831 RepID=UPI00136E3BC3|nr:peptidoglycan-binding protein [Clostridium sp. C8-1-8]
MIKLGSTGVEVTKLQENLMTLGYKVGTSGADGSFGRDTYEAVLEFQRDNNLKPDGIVGDITEEEIYKAILNNKAKLSQSLGERATSIYISGEQLRAIGWKNVNINIITDLNHCLQKYEITTFPRIWHFISQCSYESGLGLYTKEIGSGLAYEYRSSLGNRYAGDGPKYKGAGYIQLTGYDNYVRFAEDIDDQRVMEGADYVSVMYPWMSAGFWWHSNNMNDLCDKGATVEEVTLRVNGGYSGLETRKKYYDLCVSVIN